MSSIKPIALIILDGFGYRKDHQYNAIYHARKPNLDSWFATYPHTLLKASGKAVGLPEGYMGNSEVGHTTIGTGRIIPQPLTIMQQAIRTKTFFSNPALRQGLHALKKTGGVLHIIGLLSNAGVHSDIETLYAFLDAAHSNGIRHVFIHAFLDGRDTPPRSAQQYLHQLEQALDSLEYGSLGSVHGRFYAMDHNKNWDRTQQSYEILTSPKQLPYHDWQEYIKRSYEQGITDEFIVPARIDPTSIIHNGDGLIFFNFRADSMQQLVSALIDPHFNAFKTKPLALACCITPTNYHLSIPTQIMFPPKPPHNTLKHLLAQAHKKIFSIAETEKYAHITYFFDGGNEAAYQQETRMFIPSLTAKTFAAHPEMSALAITQAVLESLATNPCDFYLINYANADMVGHSGDFKATIRAVECLDQELKKLFDYIVTKQHGTMIITADHGNAEEMFDPKTGQPKTSHTTNMVSCIVMNKELENTHAKLPMQQLADIAPYILKLFHIPIPPEMRRDG